MFIPSIIGHSLGMFRLKDNPYNTLSPYIKYKTKYIKRRTKLKRQQII